MKSWLKDNDRHIYSTQNEGKSVFAERFIRTLKNKIYKYMAAKSKNTLHKLQKCILINYKNKYQYNIKYNIKIQSQNTIIKTKGQLK